MFKGTVSQRWFFWVHTTYVLVEKKEHLFYYTLLSRGLIWYLSHWRPPGRVGQSVTCPATDASLDCISRGSRVRSHTFVEIDHEIVSTVFSLPSTESCWIIQEVLLSLTSESMCTKYWLTACPRWTNRPAMTIAVDLGRKATKQTSTGDHWMLRLAGASASLTRAFAVPAKMIEYWFSRVWFWNVN